MKLRLHTQAQNSAGERVRIALNLKQLGYEYIPIPALDTPEYRDINPQGLMPSLEVDGAVLTQSLAIMAYLEETVPTPTILPIDPVSRAQANAFALAICAELHALTVKRVRKRLPQSETQAWYEHWTQDTFAALENTLQQSTAKSLFCLADYPTVADIALVPQMENARRFGCDLTAYPTLRAIDARCQALAPFAAARPERQADYKP